MLALDCGARLAGAVETKVGKCFANCFAAHLLASSAGGERRTSWLRYGLLLLALCEDRQHLRKTEACLSAGSSLCCDRKILSSNSAASRSWEKSSYTKKAGTGANCMHSSLVVIVLRAANGQL